MTHIPVLVDEVIHYLHPVPGKNYIDATADGGGHAVAIAQAIQPNGKFLAIEWDEELIPVLNERLSSVCSPSNKNYVLRQASYVDLARITHSLKFKPVAGVLFDLGLSSFHLEGSKRGFNFQHSELLDMRYSKTIERSARDLLASLDAKEIEGIIKEFGEERFAKAIATNIVRTRVKHPIRTSADFVEIIRQSIPVRFREHRIHFATRTFQALRIAVNRELENIEEGLAAAAQVVDAGGRIVVISFHSLEDRIVKQFFKTEQIRNQFITLTKKPIMATQEEIVKNPRSRSARLRAFEKK
jgi:16S rRNA (cytosine1402-N4)-methyltransferase